MVKRSYLIVYLSLLSAYLAMAFFAHRYSTFPGDSAISGWLTPLDWPPLHGLMMAISALGAWPLSAIAVIIVVGLLLWKRHRFEALLVAAVPLLADGLSLLSKDLVARPRPPGAAGDGSFPSGHVVYAVAFYGLLGIILPWLISGRALRPLQAVLVALIAFMMLSRVYLGAHWPSDTVGGLMLGALVALPAFWLLQNRRPEPVVA